MSGPPSFPAVEGNSFYSDAAAEDDAKCPSISEIQTGVESTYNTDHQHQDLTNKSPSISEIHGGLKSSISDNKDSVNGDKYLPPPSRDQMREAVDSQTNSDPPPPQEPPPGLSDADPRGESETKKERRRKFTSSRYKADDDDDDDDDLN